MLTCFSWLVGNKEPFVVSLNEDEVALCSFAWLTPPPSTDILGGIFPRCTVVAPSPTFLAPTGWQLVPGRAVLVHDMPRVLPSSTGYSWRCVTTQRTEAPLWLKVVAR